MNFKEIEGKDVVLECLKFVKVVVEEEFLSLKKEMMIIWNVFEVVNNKIKLLENSLK